MITACLTGLKGQDSAVLQLISRLTVGGTQNGEARYQELVFDPTCRQIIKLHPWMSNSNLFSRKFIIVLDKPQVKLHCNLTRIKGRHVRAFDCSQVTYGLFFRHFVFLGRNVFSFVRTAQKSYTTSVTDKCRYTSLFKELQVRSLRVTSICVLDSTW